MEGINGVSSIKALQGTSKASKSVENTKTGKVSDNTSEDAKVTLEVKDGFSEKIKLPENEEVKSQSDFKKGLFSSTKITITKSQDENGKTIMTAYIHDAKGKIQSKTVADSSGQFLEKTTYDKKGNETVQDGKEAMSNMKGGSDDYNIYNYLLGQVGR